MDLEPTEMKKSQHSLIFQTINGLTKDEDYRQELWVNYLSGAPSAALSNRLTQIQRENDQYGKLQEAIWTMHRDPPPPELLDFLKNFSEFEQSIMFLLLLGVSVNKLAEYKDISLVRIRQIITAIRNNPVWEEKWHLNVASQKKKNTD